MVEGTEVVQKRTDSLTPEQPRKPVRSASYHESRDQPFQEKLSIDDTVWPQSRKFDQFLEAMKDSGSRDEQEVKEEGETYGRQVPRRKNSGKAIAMDPESIAMRNEMAAKALEEAQATAQRQHSVLRSPWGGADPAASASVPPIPTGPVSGEAKSSGAAPIKSILKKKVSQEVQIQVEEANRLRLSSGQDTPEGPSREPWDESPGSSSGPVILEGGFDAGPKTTPRHGAVHDHGGP